MNKNILAESLRAFCSINDEDMADILDCFHFSHLKKNEHFSKEGQVSRKIAFIIRGQIRQYYSGEHQENTRWICFANDFVTSLQSFISTIPSQENVQAIMDCQLLIIKRSDFYHLIATNAGFKDFYIKALEYNYLTIEDRVYSLIDKSAEERFEWMAQKQLRFIQEVPVMYTASMLGITPRHLSRLRKKYRI